MSSFDVLTPICIYIYPDSENLFASSYYLLCFAFALYFAITCILTEGGVYAWMSGHLVYEGQSIHCNIMEIMMSNGS